MMFNSIKTSPYEFYEQLAPCAKIISIGGIILAFYIPYRYMIARQRKTPIKNDYKQGMVYLYQFPRVKCVPNTSPFCLKLETWLRMANIQYENICSWSVRSLEGTLPFLEYNGKEYPDSALAIRDMTMIFSKESMESHLSEEQKATARAFEAMAENSLAMANGYFRFAEHFDEVFQQLPDGAFGILTPFWKVLLKKMMTFKIKKRMQLLAIGKHSHEEIINIATDDLKAISAYLGSKHFFTGFKPTRVDAALFGVLCQIVYAPYDFPPKITIEKELPNLKEYCDRIKARYWPDWDKCTTEFTTNSDWKHKI